MRRVPTSKCDPFNHFLVPSFFPGRIFQKWAVSFTEHVTERFHDFFAFTPPQNIRDRRGELLYLETTLKLSLEEIHSATKATTLISIHLTSRLDHQITQFKKARTLFNCVASFHPGQCVFSRNSVKSLSSFSDFVLLLWIICQIFVLNWSDLPNSLFPNSLHRFSSDSVTRSCALLTCSCIFPGALSSSVTTLRSQCFLESGSDNIKNFRIFNDTFFKHRIWFLCLSFPCNF